MDIDPFLGASVKVNRECSSALFGVELPQRAGGGAEGRVVEAGVAWMARVVREHLGVLERHLHLHLHRAGPCHITGFKRPAVGNTGVPRQ